MFLDLQALKYSLLLNDRKCFSFPLFLFIYSVTYLLFLIECFLIVAAGWLFLNLKLLDFLKYKMYFHDRIPLKSGSSAWSSNKTRAELQFTPFSSAGTRQCDTRVVNSSGAGASSVSCWRQDVFSSVFSSGSWTLSGGCGANLRPLSGGAAGHQLEAWDKVTPNR